MVKGYFLCWACDEVYQKVVHEDWAGWSCPKCGARTSGTGGEVVTVFGKQVVKTLSP